MSSISTEERKRVLREIVIFLRSVQRYDERDLANRYPYEQREFRLLMWEAKEKIFAEDEIVFAPVRGWPGTFERKQWDQIEARAYRQRRRGTRAHKRAELRLRAAAKTAPDEAKERLRDAADRMALRIAMRDKP